jgi:hypothetical protein
MQWAALAGAPGRLPSNEWVVVQQVYLPQAHELGVIAKRHFDN